MYPFHSESDRDYHAWLGLYIGCWATFEYTLYKLICLLADLKFAPKVCEGKMISLERKLKEIKKAFTNNAELAEELSEALALVAFVEEEAQFRHNLIHGVNAQLLKVETFHKKMWRPEIVGSKPASEDVMLVTQSEIRDHYEKTGMAGLAVISLYTRLEEMYEHVSPGRSEEKS